MENINHTFTQSFSQTALSPHPIYPTLFTYNHLHTKKVPFTITLPHLKIVIDEIDYLILPGTTGNNVTTSNTILNFQQDTYRFWYQIEGFGILQNVTRKTFGTARPGLLGVMEHGERHTYLHQKGTFSCFQILFSLFPSIQSKCYWNSEIEGKAILDNLNQSTIEMTIDTILKHSASHMPAPEMLLCSALLHLISQLLDKQLIIIEESRFPRYKSRSLVNKARNYINTHYQSMHHQQALIEQCHVDINYLNILFKKEMGQTLYHYLSSVRMEHAKHLLETTKESVGEIASNTGYPNANSFSRAFKRIEKCTPLEYRTRMKLRTP